jgi:TonB family protein
MRPRPVAEVEIDSIQYFGAKTENCNLGPIGGVQKIRSAIVFPEIARRAHVSGSLQVRVYINYKGDIDSVRIIKSDVELLNQAAIDGVTNVKYFPAPDSATTRYSIAVFIRFSITSIEEISFEHKKGYQKPHIKVSIKNDGTCTYSSITKEEGVKTFSGYITNDEYYTAATAIRNQIPMIPKIIPYRRNDSTIVINYTENGNTRTFAGGFNNIDNSAFWTIDAIFEKLINTIQWSEIPPN